MAGEFQPQLTAPKIQAAPTGAGISPVIAGLDTLLSAGIAISASGKEQAKTARSNEALNILLSGTGQEVGGIPDDDPEIGKITKADKAAKQTGNVSRATAALNLGVKKLGALGFSELEIQAALKTKGLSDPRITRLEEIQAAEDDVEESQNRLIDTQVASAGSKYQLNTNGENLLLSGGTYDREKSAALLRKDQVVQEGLIAMAKADFTKLMAEGMDPKNPNSLPALVQSAVGPLTDALTDELAKTTPNVDNILRINTQGQGIVKNLREQQGLLLAQIVDKKQLELVKARTDALIAPYEAQFFADASDMATLSQITTQNNFVAALDKLTFRRDVPLLSIAGNISPEVQKFFLQQPFFKAILAGDTDIATARFGEWYRSAGSMSPILDTPDEKARVEAGGTPKSRNPIITEEAAIAAANMLAGQTKLGSGQGTPQEIKARDESMTNPIDGNLSGDAPSMLEINSRMVLDPDAIANFSLRDNQEVIHKTWANPRIARQVEMLEVKKPGAGRALGAAVSSQVSKIALQTAVELGKVPGFLEAFVIGVDPATQRMKVTVGTPTAAGLTPFLGLNPRNAGITRVAKRAAEMLNEQVEALVLYSKYDARMEGLSDIQKRQFFQEALLSTAAAKELGVTEDIIQFLPEPEEEKKTSAPVTSSLTNSDLSAEEEGVAVSLIEDAVNRLPAGRVGDAVRKRLATIATASERVTQAKPER